MTAEPKRVELTEAERLDSIDALHKKIARTLSEHRQSFGHNDEQFWSYCSCNENEPHVMEDGPDIPDPVEKRAFWATGVEIFAEHLAAQAVDEVETAGWVSPEEATAREAAARREALLEAKGALLAQAATISDEPLTAYGVADLYQMGRKDGYRFGAGVVAHLAEPERDEEGGR